MGSQPENQPLLVKDLESNSYLAAENSAEHVAETDGSNRLVTGRAARRVPTKKATFTIPKAPSAQLNNQLASRGRHPAMVIRARTRRRKVKVKAMSRCSS
jgi:hypothetical protein